MAAAKTAAKEKMVTVTIPFEKDKPDLFVSRNGVTYKIKRGVKVTIPEGIVEIIENSAEMDRLAVLRQEKLAQQGL